MPSSSSETFDVAIVGAGVIGCSIAYSLACKSQSKLKIAVIERQSPGSETSAGAAGMVAAQIECETRSPFAELCARSRAMFPKLSTELKMASGVDVEFMPSGILEIAWDAEREKILKRRMAWQKEAGLSCEWISGEEVSNRIPFFKKGAAGAFWVPKDGQVSANRLAAAFAEAARNLGVTFFDQESVESFERKGARIGSLQTSRRMIAAEKFVFAAGPWTGEVLKDIVRVHPVKGQILIFEMPEAWLSRYPWQVPIYFGDSPGERPIHCYFVPKGDGHLLLGATMEQAGFDRSENPDASRRMSEFATQVFPELARFPYKGVWTGFRPGTADKLPVLGQVPGFDNAYVASGHLRNGILLSPITGELFAELLLDGRASFDLSPFSPDRFLKIA